MEIIRSDFGTTAAGEQVSLFTLRNDNSVSVAITNYGAIIQSFYVPDRNGKAENIVLNYESLAGYLNDPFYLGCIVGRVAGRIAGAAFAINGATYHLAANSGDTGNHIHGGIAGFNQKVFDIKSAEATAHSARLVLTCFSPDGEEGYPGNLALTVTCELTSKNELIIGYRAETDRPTPVNLTNHSYFNLGGDGENALDNELQICAESVLETDPVWIPTGSTLPVANTPFDYRQPRNISDSFRDPAFNGHNEYFILDKKEKNAAVLYNEKSGRKLSVQTSEPGLILYTADYLDAPFIKCQGVCLETMGYPDAPNHKSFPSVIVVPGKPYEAMVGMRVEWA